MEMINSNYKSITETAQELGVTRATVWLRIRLGYMKATRLGRYWFVPQSEIDSWKAKKK